MVKSDTPRIMAVELASANNRCDDIQSDTPGTAADLSFRLDNTCDDVQSDTPPGILAVGL